jgi:hypothetical protein
VYPRLAGHTTQIDKAVPYQCACHLLDPSCWMLSPPRPASTTPGSTGEATTTIRPETTRTQPSGVDKSSPVSSRSHRALRAPPLHLVLALAPFFLCRLGYLLRWGLVLVCCLPKPLIPALTPTTRHCTTDDQIASDLIPQASPPPRPFA